jgi:hypothetical protein
MKKVFRRTLRVAGFSVGDAAEFLGLSARSPASSTCAWPSAAPCASAGRSAA